MALGTTPLSVLPLSALLAGGAVSVAIDMAEETDSVISGITSLKTLAIEMAEETDSALIWAYPFERATDTDEARDFTSLKTLAIETAEETDSALIWAYPFERATDTDEARTLTSLKTLTIEMAEETYSALTLTVVRSLLLDRAMDPSDEARELTVVKSLVLDMAEEADSAREVSRPLSIVMETDEARDIVVERNHATVTGVGTCTFNWLYSTLCRDPDTASGGVTPLNTSLHPSPAFFRHDRSLLEDLESEAIDRKVQIVYEGTDEWLPLLPGTSGLMRDYGITIRVGYFTGDHDWRSQAIIADDEHTIALALADRASWPTCVNAITPRSSSLTPIDDVRSILEMRWVVQTTGSDTYPHSRGIAQGSRSSGAGPATAAIETLYDIICRDPDTAADRLLPGSTALHAPGFTRFDRDGIDRLESESIDRRVQVIYEGTANWEWPAFGQRRTLLLTVRVGYFVGDHELRTYPVMVDDEQQIVQAVMDPSNWTGCVHGFYPVASNVVVLDEARQVLEIRFESQVTTT